MIHARTLTAALMLWCGSLASPVLAQSPYVVASVGADISRAGSAIPEDFTSALVSGESASGAIRVGVTRNPLFGIELEIAQGRQIGRKSTVEVGPLPQIFTDPIDAVVERTHRVMTISALGSVRQRINDATNLVYLAGVAFYRITIDLRANLVPRDRLPIEVFPDTASVSQLIGYGARPVVGLEAHVDLNEHLRIVPGVRVHALDAFWLVRPSVGLGWVF